MALAITGARLCGNEIGLRVADGRIEELGSDVVARAGDEVIDAAGLALIPGLVNAHTHAAMTLFRGYADDLPLMEWLQRYIWPAEQRLEREDVYWGTRLACLLACHGMRLACPTENLSSQPQPSHHRQSRHRLHRRSHHRRHHRPHRRHHHPHSPSAAASRKCAA